MIASGGRWIEQSKEHWVVRCLNSHTGDGETLLQAIENLERQGRA